MVRGQFWLIGWCLVVALAGCTSRQPAPAAPPDIGDSADLSAGAGAAQPEPTTLHRLAMSVVVPADWHELEPDEAEVDRLSAIFQRTDGGELPQIQITLSKAAQFADARANGLEPRQLVVDVLRSSIEGVGNADQDAAGKVTREEPWTAPGIVTGTHLRIEGQLPSAEFGADQGVVDVMVGETAGGDIYTVLVAANDVAGVEQAQPLLASAEYGLGGEPPLEVPATDASAPEADAEAPATDAAPQPVTPLPEAADAPRGD